MGKPGKRARLAGRLHEHWDMDTMEQPKPLSSAEQRNWLRAAAKGTPVASDAQATFFHETHADDYGSDYGSDNTNTDREPYMGDMSDPNEYVTDDSTEGLLTAVLELLTLAKDCPPTKPPVEPAFEWNERQEPFATNWDQVQQQVLLYLAGGLSDFAVFEGEICSNCSKPASVSCSACDSFFAKVRYPTKLRST